MNLVQRASECADQLAKIKVLAEEGKNDRSRWFSTTGLLLDDVISQVDNAYRKLQFWVLEVRRGNQTTETSAIQLLEALFVQLEERIEATRRAVKIRLNNRRFHGHGFRASKR
jgi:hypothetical protein